MKNTIQTIIIAIIGGMTVIVAQQFFGEKTTIVYNEGVEYKIPGRQANYHGENNLPVFTDISERSLNCVVHVKTLFAEDKADNPLIDFFFGYGNGESEPVFSAGSGVIVSSDGYIVTNNHVVSKSTRIKVVLNDKRTYFAKVIGTDEATDLALLKIDEVGLSYMKYANSDKIRIGEWALAIGNPFNLTSTVTAGIISAKARNINLIDTEYAIESFIQTDAAVNPGNSGGALVNSSGELVGINTAIASRTGSFSGYSFAVPSNIVEKVVADLIEYGVVQRALLGVAIKDLNAEKARLLNIEKIEGVYVEKVTENGAAEQAGIAAGDLITKINETSVNKVAEIQEQISKYRPGDKVDVAIKRDNHIFNYMVTLQNKQGNTNLFKIGKVESLGVTFVELTDDEKLALKIDVGVKVATVSSGKFLKAGIPEGFVITKINRKAVNSIVEINNILNNYSGGVYIEGKKTDGTVEYFAFGINAD